ncbi:MAG: IS66 family insertion sequence element accessory protein TnpB [Anaerorhabdus sp.]
MVKGITDLRKGIDGYASIIQNNMKLNPFSNSLFIFCNRHRDKIKCLYWDGNSFWLLYKRLEQGHFKWRKDEDGTLLLTKQQLNWLLEGLKIEQKTAFKDSNYIYV